MATTQTETHTKGPWLVEKRDTAFQIVAADGIRVLGTSWHSHLRNPYPLEGEAFANARLAAAAPDMLEALRGARLFLASSRQKLPQIDAAIAKAEGRQS